jgi:hypothetical protein
MMATILEFPRLRPQAAHEIAAHRPAEIVIFPGVRIERTEFNLAERLSAPRRRRRPARSPAVETEE